MLPHGIIALAVHPGAVGTEQQKGATEAYPAPVGKALEAAAKVMFMSKEQGSESALWAGTSPAVAKRRQEVQGRYFTEADGKVRPSLASSLKVVADDVPRSTQNRTRPRTRRLSKTFGTCASRRSRTRPTTTSRSASDPREPWLLKWFIAALYLHKHKNPMQMRSRTETEDTLLGVAV